MLNKVKNTFLPRSKEKSLHNKNVLSRTIKICRKPHKKDKASTAIACELRSRL